MKMIKKASLIEKLAFTFILMIALLIFIPACGAVFNNDVICYEDSYEESCDN